MKEYKYSCDNCKIQTRHFGNLKLHKQSKHKSIFLDKGSDAKSLAKSGCSFLLKGLNKSDIFFRNINSLLDIKETMVAKAIQTLALIFICSY